MPTHLDIRFIYRVRPVSSFTGYLVSTAICAFVGIWIWTVHSSTGWAIVALVLAFLNVLCACFLRTRIFIVNADGLTIIKRPLIRIGGTFDFYEISRIRRVRYRSETHVHVENEGDRRETASSSNSSPPIPKSSPFCPSRTIPSTPAWANASPPPSTYPTRNISKTRVATPCNPPHMQTAIRRLLKIENQ